MKKERKRKKKEKESELDVPWMQQYAIFSMHHTTSNLSCSFRSFCARPLSFLLPSFSEALKTRT